MVRLYVLCALALLKQGTGPVPRPPQPSIAKQKSADTNQQKASHNKENASPKAAVTKSNPTPNPANANTDNIKPGNNENSVRIVSIPPVTTTRDAPSFILSLILAIIGIVGIIVAICTVKYIAAQARIMRHQSVILRHQTRATARAAKAAEDSVAAINKQADIMESQTRARLRITPQPLRLLPRLNGFTYFADFNMSIHGSTSAFTINSGCAAYLRPEKLVGDPDADIPLMDDFPELPPEIAPQTKPLFEFAIFHHKAESADEFITEIKNDRLFVELRGFVKYRDVFEKVRETRFRYAWKFSYFFPTDKPDRPGDWERCGTEEDNKET